MTAANDPRYDEATVELVAAATEQHHLDIGDVDADGHTGCVCGHWRDSAETEGWDEHMAEVTLTALADAGLLLPPDVEANRQYGRRTPNGLVLTSHLPDPTHYRLNGPWKELPGD